MRTRWRLESEMILDGLMFLPVEGKTKNGRTCSAQIGAHASLLLTPSLETHHTSMSTLHHVNTFLRKGKEKARLLTTELKRSFSLQPSSEVGASLGVDGAYPSSSTSSAVIKPPVDSLQARQIGSLMITDDQAGGAVPSGLGATRLLPSVSERPIIMPLIVEGSVPVADTSTATQASLPPTSSPLIDSVVISDAVMSSEQAILLHAPHAVEPVILGPFSGSQNVMVMNSTINMTNNVKMGQNTPDLVSQKPNSSTLFTGRKEVLEQLKHHFAPRLNRERRLFLLYGMGGIGKTQICLRFAEEMSDLIPQIFWVDASSTDTIILSLKAISGNADSSALSTLQRIAALENDWLLVFDNADGGPEVVEKFLPPGSKGNILITSRNCALERITLVENSLGLPEMAKEDAVILLQKSSCLGSLVKDHPNLAEKIVSELCCLPLAVDQAGAAIHSGLCDVHKYLEHLSYQRERLMSHPLFRGASQYNRTVYGTFELSYGEIEARATRPDPYVANSAQTAILILQTCAFYHYDRISKDIFKHAAEKSRQRDVEDEIKSGLPLAITSLDYRLLPVDKAGHWDELFFNQGLQVLLSFSLIKRSSSSDVFAMHPLVHSWSQDRMS
ncbi:P-loop containing nucleoside triphosphate hydrolase protein, partial [Crassisporium funariophilum]